MAAPIKQVNRLNLIRPTCLRTPVRHVPRLYTALTVSSVATLTIATTVSISQNMTLSDGML